MKKLFVVSSTSFPTLADAEFQLDLWRKEGTLSNGAIVYEVSAKYVPVMKLIKKK